MDAAVDEDGRLGLEEEARSSDLDHFQLAAFVAVADAERGRDARIVGGERVDEVVYFRQFLISLRDCCVSGWKLHWATWWAKKITSKNDVESARALGERYSSAAFGSLNCARSLFTTLFVFY